MGGGFFNKLVKDVEDVINERVNTGSIIDVRSIRRMMGIESTNHSKTVFISKALDKLTEDGILEIFERKTVKRYKKRL
ncbi:MAG: hypothetical protein ACTSVI_01855 [Promethearchaeota archaeon]